MEAVSKNTVGDFPQQLYSLWNSARLVSLTFNEGYGAFVTLNFANFILLLMNATGLAVWVVWV